MQNILWKIKEILPTESIKLAAKNIAVEITSDDDIAKLNKQLKNTDEAKKNTSNKIKNNLENNGFTIPQNFEKNPLWYIYFKIINFMKQKWIIIKWLNWWETKYTNIKYKDIYETTSINIWSLYWKVANEDHEYIISMIEKFKEIYKFNKTKTEIKEKIEKHKQYKKNSKFFAKHEIVVAANKKEKNKILANEINKIKIKIEDYIFPTNFSEMIENKKNYEKIKKEKIKTHKKIWINYVTINNNNQIIWLQNEIESRQNNPLLKQYQKQLEVNKNINEEKINYIKKIKILKLKLAETDIKTEDIKKEIEEIEIEIKKYKTKIQEYNERINQIENELNKSTWSLKELKKIDISKLKTIASSLEKEKEKIEKEIIPRLEKRITNLEEEKNKTINQKEELKKDKNNNLSEQYSLKKEQNKSIRRSVKVKTSMVQAKLDPEISYGISHLQELLKYDNICIKFEEDNYNIYLDTSKKINEDWSMYPMMYNHHKPAIIASFTKKEFDSISNLYPVFKTHLNNQINKNAKNAFLSDRINSKNTIDLN